MSLNKEELKQIVGIIDFAKECGEIEPKDDQLKDKINNINDDLFTIEEIKNYLAKQDSFGDVFYNLSVENIIKANEIENDDPIFS